MKYIAGFAFLFLISCSGNADKKIEHSFYFWQTSFPRDSNNNSLIQKQGIGHFYIHYFDVDWDENRYMPVPIAEINGFENALPFLQSHFTPVVFITNRCFEKMNTNWCDSLPFKIRDKINFITNKLQQADTGKTNTIEEIQIDCDWTAATHEKYFLFLKNFKSLYPDKIISATIRLYPYKYYDKTGVPPVDKGLLMCYNLTDIKIAGNPNSIFNLKSLQQYLVAKKYPLPLDIALPIFEWYAWFSEGKFKGIVYPDENDTLSTDKHFYKQKENDFLLTADTMINNNYLREGDVLRLEKPGEDELNDAAKLLHNKFPETKRIALFYWDKFLIKKNETAIHKIYAAF